MTDSKIDESDSDIPEMNSKDTLKKTSRRGSLINDSTKQPKNKRRQSMIEVPKGRRKSIIEVPRIRKQSLNEGQRSRKQSIVDFSEDLNSFERSEISTALISFVEIMKKKKMQEEGFGSDEDREEVEPAEVEELRQYMIELEKTNEKIEAYNEYLKDKTLEFNGYSKTNSNDKSITTELKRKCVNAVMRGDINEVEFILESPEADINLTWFSENLLMVAIRAQKESMAEFLITKGINVSHEIELKEFTEEAPINYYKYSCRDMAFDYGLYNIINLIDIFNENTNENIIQYLGKKYLQSNLKINKSADKDSHNSNKKHLEKFNVSQQNDIIKDDLSDKLDANSEINLFKDIEDLKPGSGYGYKLKGNIDEAWDTLSERSISTASLISTDAVIKNPISYKQSKPFRLKDQKELTQNILERIKTKKTKSIKPNENKNILPEKIVQKCPPLILPDHKKSTSCSSLTPRSISNRISHRIEKQIDIKNKSSKSLTKMTFPTIDFTGSVDRNDFINMTKSFNVDKMYLKKNDTIKTIEDKYLLKELSDKLSNHRYLSYLKEKPGNKTIIENNLRKYNEPMFPFKAVLLDPSVNESRELKLPAITNKETKIKLG